jgi:hypothetical protein
MDDRVPWTGGISNRKILTDSLRELSVWVAVSFSLFVLTWWITGSIQFANSNWRAPACVAVALVIGRPIAKWCRA